jgi:hypothetical protein
MEHLFECPHCLAQFSSAIPASPTKELKCPKCKQQFLADPADTIAEAEPPLEKAPKKSAKRRRDQEDDTSGEKQGAKKKRSEIIDDDEDDEPAPKKARTREEDYYAESRRKRKEKTASRILLDRLIVIGALLGMMGCCCAGGGFYYISYYNPMIGKWEPTPAKDDTVTWEFGYFGSGRARVKNYNRKTQMYEQYTIHFNYSYKSGNPPVLGINLTELVGVAPKDFRGGGGRFHVVFRDGDAVLTEVGKAGEVVLRRVP